MEWKTCKISDLAVIISGGTPKTTIESFWNGNIPWLSVKDFSGDSKYVYTTEKTITDEGLKHSTANLLSAQDIVISARGTVGELAMLPFPMSLNQSCFGLRARCDADFLYYLLKVKVAEFKQRANGGVFGTIIRTTFDKVKCRIPDSLECQHRIASILSSYDSLIENNTKRIRLLEKMAENLYKEWFVRFRFPGYEKAEMENGLPKGWKVERLGEWGISLDTGKRPKGGIDISLKDGYPSLGAECIKELAFFDYSSVSLIPKDFYESMKRGKNTGDDILLYKDGAYIGKVTMFMDKYPYEHYAINEHVFFVAPKNVEYKNYLYFTLHQNEFFVLMQNLNRNAAQPGLSRGDVEKVQMTIPTSEVVKQFNQVVKPMLKIMFNLAKQNTLLARRRDLLLPRLMSGKLEVKP